MFTVPWSPTSQPRDSIGEYIMWKGNVNGICSLELAWSRPVAKDTDHSLKSRVGGRGSPECYIPTKKHLQCSNQESGNTWGKGEIEHGLWGKAVCQCVRVGSWTWAPFPRVYCDEAEEGTGWSASRAQKEKNRQVGQIRHQSVEATICFHGRWSAECPRCGKFERRQKKQLKKVEELQCPVVVRKKGKLISSQGQRWGERTEKGKNMRSKFGYY